MIQPLLPNHIEDLANSGLSLCCIALPGVWNWLSRVRRTVFPPHSSRFLAKKSKQIPSYKSWSMSFGRKVTHATSRELTVAAKVESPIAVESLPRMTCCLSRVDVELWRAAEPHLQGSRLYHATRPRSSTLDVRPQFKLSATNGF